MASICPEKYRVFPIDKKIFRDILCDILINKLNLLNRRHKNGRTSIRPKIKKSYVG